MVKINYQPSVVVGAAAEAAVVAKAAEAAEAAEGDTVAAAQQTYHLPMPS